jgi:hypothetical protein
MPFYKSPEKPISPNCFELHLLEKKDLIKPSILDKCVSILRSSRLYQCHRAKLAVASK